MRLQYLLRPPHPTPGPCGCAPGTKFAAAAKQYLQIKLLLSRLQSPLMGQGVAGSEATGCNNPPLSLRTAKSGQSKAPALFQ